MRYLNAERYLYLYTLPFFPVTIFFFFAASQARVLESVGWERVDVFNDDGLNPHKDLVVANQWFNGEGEDIVRHLVDHAPNKPPGDSRRGSSTQGEVEEERNTLPEDLITGLDDDYGDEDDAA